MTSGVLGARVRPLHKKNHTFDKHKNELPLYVHKANHMVFKAQPLVIGQFEKPSHQKKNQLCFTFYVIGWCYHVDKSQGAGF